MPAISTCLWFDHEAEEAANTYVAIFPNSRITSIAHYDESTAEASGMPVGSVLTVAFELDGRPFLALNGGRRTTFTEATSFMVLCETQDQIDYYWERLTEGGEEVWCGWLKDRYGVSWQVAPAQVEEWLKNPEGAKRMMAEMLKMRKLDLAILQQAYEG